MSAQPVEADPRDVRHALRAPGLLREFNAAGVLGPADVHVALRLGAIAGTADEDLLLAAALAVRGPRLGHVCVDLETIRGSAAVDADETVDLSALPWPDPGPWLERVAAWDLTAHGDEEDDGAARPLRLVGRTLYLDRYWREERQVADDLAAFAAPADGVDEALLATGLARLFPGETGSRQCLAAAAAVLRRFAVVAGGPGTGKTTTVARIVALLREQAGVGPAPLVALAAPTGKAAARLQQAVREAAGDLPASDAAREMLRTLEASTLHRLLGWRPGSHSRFRHHRANRLPHDVVIVDETSMVSLSLMARLAEAVRPTARLILVGDPGQLASIEAGVVLGDIVGPTTAGLRIAPATRARLEAAVGEPVAAETPPAGAGVADGIVVLDRVHRYGGAIARVAEAIRGGDADAVLAAFDAAGDDVRWIDADAGDPDATAAVRVVRDELVAAAGEVIAAAHAGDAATALEELGAFRLLCAHRRGPHGVAWWTERIEGWLAEDVERFAADAGWYPGRPLLVTENDYSAAPLQRRHRRRGGRRRRPGRGGLRPRRRGRHAAPRAPGGGRDRLRDDRPQEPGLAVRHRCGAAAAGELADPDARAALHRGHAGARAARRRRARGVAARRGRPPDRARLGAAPPPLGRGPHGRRRKWIARVTGRKPSRW